MSGNRIRWVTGCPTGKRRYESRAMAKAARQRQPKNARFRLDTYVCSMCGDWHLGHLPRKVVRGQITRDDIDRPDTPETAAEQKKRRGRQSKT